MFCKILHIGRINNKKALVKKSFKTANDWTSDKTRVKNLIVAKN